MITIRCNSPLWGCAEDRVEMISFKVHCGLFWGIFDIVAKNSPTMYFDNHLVPVSRATSKWRKKKTLKHSPASLACHSKMPRGVEERKKPIKMFMFKFQKQMLLTDLPLWGDSRRNIHFPCCKVVLFGVLLLQAVWHRSVPDLLPIYP